MQAVLAFLAQHPHPLSQTQAAALIPPRDAPPDVPKAGLGVLFWLSRMPAPTSQAFAHQVGAQPLLSPNFHNMKFTDILSTLAL